MLINFLLDGAFSVEDLQDLTGQFAAAEVLDDWDLARSAFERLLEYAIPHSRAQSTEPPPPARIRPGVYFCEVD